MPIVAKELSTSHACTNHKAPVAIEAKVGGEFDSPNFVSKFAIFFEIVILASDEVISLGNPNCVPVAFVYGGIILCS